MRELLTTPVAYCLIGIALALFHPIRADWMGLVVLGFLIALYAFLAKGEKTAERFTVGDNSYIIGFVYTLSIITLSLVLDAGDLLGSDGDPGELHPLLKTIGIALGTSVIGMICRFLLTHGIEVGEDAFDRAVGRTAVAAAKLDGTVTRLELAAEKIAGAIERIATATNGYAERVEAESAGAGEALADTAKRMFQGAEREFAAALKELARATESVSECVTADWQSAVAPVRQSLDEASGAIEGYAKAIESETLLVGEGLNRAVEGVIGSLGEHVARSLEEQVFDQFRTATTALVNEQTNVVRQNGRLLADAQSNLNQQLHNAVATHESVVAGVGGSLTDALDLLKRQVNVSVAVTEEIRSLAQRWRGAVDPIALPTIEEAMQRIVRNVETLDTALESIAGQQSKAVSDAEGHVKRLREAAVARDALLRELQRDIEGISDLKQRYRKEFDRAASGALDETHRLYARLIGAAAVALSGLDNVEAFARDVRTIAERLDGDHIRRQPGIDSR